ELLAVTWSDVGPTGARVLGGEIGAGYTPDVITDATQWAHGAAPAGVAVELPSRVPAYWRTAIDKVTAGSPPWRHAQRQLLVSAAALGDRGLLADALEALRTSGGVELGDIVLASGALVTAMND